MQQIDSFQIGYGKVVVRPMAVKLLRKNMDRYADINPTCLESSGELVRGGGLISDPGTLKIVSIWR